MFERLDETARQLPPDPAHAETYLFELRSRPAGTKAAFRAALACAVAPGSEPPMLPSVIRAGVHVLNAAEQVVVSRGTEPAYHNRHHVAEAMLATGWLCCAAGVEGISASDAALAVLAMAGHDLAHDGSHCLDGRLEREASVATQAICSDAGLSADACARVGHLILATAPKSQGDRATQAFQVPREVDLAALCVLVREADVFASLLPRLGWRLTFALRRELRRAREPIADSVVSFVSRQRFLSAYRPRSAAASRLGLADTTAWQLAGFEQCGVQLGAGPDGPIGAALLDEICRMRAARIYRAALAKVMAV